jgi:hypothetical protein
MKVDPTRKIMLSRSIELSSVNSPKVPTWHASCQCLMTGNPSWGYLGCYSMGFGELRTSMVMQDMAIYTGLGPQNRVKAFMSSRREPLHWIALYDYVYKRYHLPLFI